MNSIKKIKIPTELLKLARAFPVDLFVVGGYGVELIEAYYGDVLEAYLSCLVAVYEFAVEAEWGLSGSESQEEGLCAVVAVDGFDDLVGYVLYAGIFGFKNLCVEFLVAAVDVSGDACGDESAVFG